MTEIIAFGQHKRKNSFFGSLWSHFKSVFLEIRSLDRFTKLTIIIAVLFSVFAYKISGELLNLVNLASQKSEVKTGLPPNCHLSVDFSSCEKNTGCEGVQNIVCEKGQ